MSALESHILVVDDEPDIRNLLQEILEDEGYHVSIADGAQAAREQRRAQRPDLILLDIWMPDTDGISLLKEWQETGAMDCPVVMMSGHGTVETAVEATRLGAYDFIEKPLSLSKLLLTVKHAMDREQLMRENIGLKSRADQVTAPLGHSAMMDNLRQQAEKIAAHDTPVLITGAPGTGKETFARYIHSLSSRSAGPLISLGAGTVVRRNSAKELFGSEQDGKIFYGLLERANAGVLFLDEVADLELEVQQQLSSALEHGSFTRVGGSEAITVNVRVIAATRFDLEQHARAGKFKEEFFYQLNVLPLALPQLKEHMDDVSVLLEYYVNFFVDAEGLSYRHFTVGAQNKLRNYGWPGNVRELKNLVQRLLILGQGETISDDDVQHALGQNISNGDMNAPASQPALLDLPLREAREKFEHDYLEQMYDLCQGKVSEMARRAGVERTHLYRKLKTLNIGK
ncbi:MAG: sigma-54-dependent Fis family transcriptional regulator [Gammaproteobacteria bacterium]|nr:sigma-54-dependent Fis family transcriptional regulator [Gammaproteobacteria bacterium]